MKFIIKKEILLPYIKKIINVITKNPIFPILENIIIDVNQKRLYLTASNLEVEMNISIHHKNYQFFQSGNISISGKKILHICRNAPKDTNLNFHLVNKKIKIQILNTIFYLMTLSIKNFPKFQKNSEKNEINISQNLLKKIIFFTRFSIANHDIRNSLNGLLLEYHNGYLYGVATDGHRLAMYKKKINIKVTSFSIILSKKSIIELYQLLEEKEDLIRIFINQNQILFYIKNIILITKLIDGKFPDYQDVILINPMQRIPIPLTQIKKSLLRTSILCDINFKGIYLKFYNNLLQIRSNNQEDEESSDSFKIQYNNKKIEFSINVFYLLDVLNTLASKIIYFILDIPVVKIQIQSLEEKNIYYVIMPLRL
ncbi:DNA polymerase III, beta subunit [Buchnera aphidicola (Cinara tujafilina)]|uniref:Beta sliding clamp n=1 Tax=Buchnera aphidicola (Cinara tujafilina) TaxID=261317 RepID=F7WYV3_9GAMM|nr:DNA polymerase III subunit beta [Buchnera aphidicola]AEH39603.1 DNA polymerase III, beta subunit [Buchnera aphidicola (Cinara tujafilina)]